jgi:O-antigen/teichoic acid export membrane protein
MEGLTSAVRKRSSFAHDVLKLVSGTTIAQAMVILASPLLTRLYAPESWGLLALFTSIASIFGVVACMRYELSIMLPEKDEEAANLLGVSLMFAVVVALLTVPVIWWGKGLILRWLNAPTLEPYLWLVPFMVFVHGVFLALTYWNSRTRRFSRLSIARITNSLTTETGKLGVGYVGYATAGVMIGAKVAGEAVATAVLSGQIWRDDRKIFIKFINWRSMQKGILRHRKFPLITTWSAFMNTVSSYIAPLMLAAFFSSTIVGFFTLGQRILTLPMALIGGSIAQVFFQRAAEGKHTGALSAVVGTTFTKLMTLGMFPILIVMVAGKDIFFVVFGSQWSEAGVYAQILAPWIMFQFISSPISTLFSVLEIQEIGLVFNVILLGTRIIAIAIGGFSNSILLALFLFSISGAILYLILCLVILKKSNVILSMKTKDALRSAIIVIVVLLPVVILKSFGFQSVIIFISACFCLALYYVIIYFHDRQLQELMECFLRRIKV